MAEAPNAARPARARRGLPTKIAYITGKGGVGKTTIARALADLATAKGLSCELVRLGDAPAGPAESEDGATRIGGDEALRHLLDRMLRLPSITSRLMSSRTFSAVANAAPGLRDIVTAAVLEDRASEGDKDLILVDGYASGHSESLLDAPRAVLELTARGPIASAAERCADMIEDADVFAPVVVALPEELPVIEAGELWAKIDEVGATAAALVVNGVFPELISDAQARTVAAAGASPDCDWFARTRAAQLGQIEAIETVTGTAPLTIDLALDARPLDAESVAQVLERVLGH